ncbi:hypothetical protein IRJ41_019991 [Triplophysa rosa]|uniref:Ig-like domain-containing protein n=2 Tax=Triplophysa rosa TaxID=992332 RepID=A0A9W7T690_TRIRA|nr:hypothetical protein IRJ41_019991 [Triplophysa rosa]
MNNSFIIHNRKRMDFNFAFISLILLTNIKDILTLEPIRVICEHKNICALSDTDVTLRCSYSNISIKTGFWFSHKQSQNWRESDEPEDIALDFDYSGRVKQQITIRQSDLTIRDVRERDSGEYQLMFIMKDGVKHISSVTVHLTVTGVSNSGCWDVTYTSRRVCALVGSTVEIHSSYSHPTGYTVVNTYWHLPNLRLRDLRDEQQFAGRVDYVRNALRIKDVNMSDSGEYQFRIITNTSDGTLSGSPGVILTVTDTQVISSPTVVSKGQKVILSCSTKCTLDNNITFLWFKNGKPVKDGFKLFNKLYLNSVNNDELKEYSCTVTGPVESQVSVHSDFLIFLIVFVVQALIIGAVWVW